MESIDSELHLDAHSPGESLWAMKVGQKVNKTGFRRVLDRESQNSEISWVVRFSLQ